MPAFLLLHPNPQAHRGSDTTSSSIGFQIGHVILGKGFFPVDLSVSDLICVKETPAPSPQPY